MSPDIEWHDILDLVEGNHAVDLNLHNYQLNDGKLRELAHALAGNTSVRSVDLSDNHVTNETAELLGKAFRAMPQLRRVMMIGNHVGAPGIRAFTRELNGHPNLLQFNLASCNGDSSIGTKYTQEEMQAWKEGMLELLGTCPNLTMMFGHVASEVSEARKAKTAQMKIWQEGLGQDATSAIVLARYGSAMEELTLYGRQRVHSTTSLRAVQKDWENIQAQNEEFLSNLPAYDPEKPITLSAVVAEDEWGFRMLDNPRNWEHFTAMADSLAEQGTPITKAMLLKKNAEGMPYLEIAAMLGKLPEALAAINAQGEQVTSADLMDAAGQPNKLMQNLIALNTGPELLSLEQCSGQTPQSVRQIHSILPEYQQRAIPLHGLLAALGREKRQAGVQR